MVIRRLQILTLLLFASLSGMAQTISPDFVEGKIYLKLDRELSAATWDQLTDQYEITSVRKPFHTPAVQDVYAIEFAARERIDDLVEVISQMPEVNYVEKVPLYYSTYTPDDIHGNQWFHNNIQAEAAWDLARGDFDIVIGVIDNAFRTDHEDLEDQIWTNPNEVPNDGLDNDNNGTIDDVQGYDVADDDLDVNPPQFSGGGWAHGSHVAGCAAATTDNGKGIASIAFGCSILPIKARKDSTTANVVDASAEGIDYAVTSGSRVVNMSFAGGNFSQTIQSIITAGHFQGIVWVAGAGNDGRWQGRFPAGYQHVISVASSEVDDRKSGFSTWHPTVDVMAPGGGIYSVFSEDPDSYIYMSGTSMASPLVAGLCGLMLSINPQMDPDEVEQCLESGCDNVDALNPDYVGLIGAGRINALNSVLCVPRLAAPMADFTFDKDTVCAGEVVTFTDLSAEYPQHWLWDFGDGSTDTSIHSTTHTYTTPGTYSVKLTVSNNMGDDSLVFLDAIEVLPAPSVTVAVLPGDTTGPILSASGCANYSWSPSADLSCSDCPNPYLPVNLPPLPNPGYIVTCTNEFGCTDSDTVFASQLVSAPAPVETGLQLEALFPNPNQGKVTLSASFTRPDDLRIRLLDLQGKEMGILYQGLSGRDFKLSVDLPEGLAPGLYLAEWNYQGLRQVQRMIYQPL